MNGDTAVHDDTAPATAPAADLAGLIPAPSRPPLIEQMPFVDAQTLREQIPLLDQAQAPLPRPRRGYNGWRVEAPELVTFTAACPACGADCEWEGRRVDTRLRTTVRCSCPA